LNSIKIVWSIKQTITSNTFCRTSQRIGNNTGSGLPYIVYMVWMGGRGCSTLSAGLSYSLHRVVSSPHTNKPGRIALRWQETEEHTRRQAICQSLDLMSLTFASAIQNSQSPESPETLAMRRQ